MVMDANSPIASPDGAHNEEDRHRHTSGEGHRRRRRRRRHKRTLSQKVKKGIGKFLQKNKSWLLVLLAAVALIGILLLGFLAVENNTIKEVSHQTEYQ
jgi:hypothetical protein